jgi:hypothetical protein
MYSPATEEFLGFTFNGKHTNDFNLVVVSDGSRYHSPLFGTFVDSILKVPGRNGTYFFGSEFESVPFAINLAFDNLTEKNFRAMQQWLSYQTLGKLIFNEAPYKYYWAKISTQPTLDFVAFEKILVLGSTRVKSLIYKGEINLTFSAYNPFGYRVAELNIDSYFGAGTAEIPIWFLGSGLLPSNYSYSNITIGTKDNIVINGSNEFYLYNGGNMETDVKFSFNIAANFTGNLEITNNYNSEKTIITPIDKAIFANVDLTEDGYNSITSYDIIIDGINKKVSAFGRSGSGIITTEKLIGQYHNGIFMKAIPIAQTELIKIKSGTYSFDWITEYNVADFVPSDGDTSAASTPPTYSGYLCSSLSKCVAFNGSYASVAGDVGKIAFLIKPNKFTINKTLSSVDVEYYYRYL